MTQRNKPRVSVEVGEGRWGLIPSTQTDVREWQRTKELSTTMWKTHGILWKTTWWVIRLHTYNNSYHGGDERELIGGGHVCVQKWTRIRNTWHRR